MTYRTSRRQAVGVIGAAAGIAGAAMPALGAPAPTPLREPLPPPLQVPRGDLVNVLEYETQARLVLGPAKIAPISAATAPSPIASLCVPG